MRVCVDCGHGGADYGAVSPHNTLHEADAALSVGLTLRDLLEPHMSVVMTRDSDVFIPLAERSRVANKAECDAFVSIHFNSAINRDAHGWEVFSTGSTKGLRLAQCVGSRHAETFPEQKVRGLKTATFSVLRKTTMPAILWEGGFVSNKGESEWISKPDIQNQMAQALSLGIMDYFGLGKELTIEDRVVRIENYLGI